MIFAPKGFSRVLPSKCEVCKDKPPLIGIDDLNGVGGATCNICGTVHLGNIVKNENLSLCYQAGRRTTKPEENMFRRIDLGSDNLPHDLISRIDVGTSCKTTCGKFILKQGVYPDYGTCKHAVIYSWSEAVS